MNYLKELVTRGFLVDEEAKDIINNLNEDDFNRLVESLKKDNPLMVSKDYVKNMFLKEVRILKEFKKKKKMSIKDYVGILNSKYDILQSILIEKLELKNVVSINKCISGPASVIGMVRTIKDKGINFEVVVEDPTGEIKTGVSKNLGSRISLDDVIAISGNMNNKIFFADKIIFPDVPLRPVNYSSDSVKVGFISEKESEVDYVVSSNQVIDNLKDKIYKIEEPALVELGGIKILVLGDNDPLEILKKRYVKINDTSFVIDIVPDIVFSEKDVNKNYKGITIVSPNNVIDLKTREVNEIL